ncbi:CCR4-NOT transcription complex subunit 1 [Phytophthora cinnamomi]|nr:CCR4-NOT transcription complex subunit 1 [Phytophthora cinnamomi]
MVVVWNSLAGGDAEYCAAIVAMNSVLTIGLYSPSAGLFINDLQSHLGIDSSAEIHVAMCVVAKNGGIYVSASARASRPTWVIYAAVPLLIYFMFMFVVSFLMGWWLGATYEQAVTLSFTAASNNFELALAVAIASFGLKSDPAQMSVVGAFIEIPTMLALVYLAFWFWPESIRYIQVFGPPAREALECVEASATARHSNTSMVASEGGTKTDEKAWVMLHKWADSTTRAWTKQAKAEMRRKTRCQNMARQRVVKKGELLQMRLERQLLEQQIKGQLAALNRSSVVQDNPTSIERELGDAVHRLILESDTLRTENTELHEKLQQHEHFQSLVNDSALDASMGSEHECNSNGETIDEASKKLRRRPTLVSSEDGWRVRYPNGEPSFYFHPFTLSEYQDAVASCTDQVDQIIPLTGRLFGWSVHRAPLTRNTGEESFHGRMKLTARVACSLDKADAMIEAENLNSWPLVFVPLNWSPAQRSKVSTQVLQSFDANSHVMVHSIPGRVHTRYFTLVRRRTGVDLNGKRWFGSMLAIKDSQANAKSQAAEEPQPNVKWISQGGICTKFSEVDETTIDVTCENWGQFDCELHAQQVFTHWIEFVCGWSRVMVQSKLLESGD